MNPAQSRSGGNSKFPDTRWSLIISAGGSECADHALNQFCQLYWYPVYAYVRSWGKSPQDAEDLTQTFFAQLLSQDSLSRTDSSKGRFRSFLLKSLKHLMQNDHRFQNRQKRGGGVQFIALDSVKAERRYALEPVDAMTPEILFERRWIMDIMQTALTQLKTEYQRGGKSRQFDTFSPFLSRSPSETEYADAAKGLGIPQSTARSHVFRMRQRYQKIIREEVAETLDNPTEVESELQHLIAVLNATGFNGVDISEKTP